MTSRFVATTATLLASLSLGTAASAQYIQLTDGDDIFADSGNTFIAGFVGDGSDAFAVISGNDVPAIQKIEDAGGANTVTTTVDSTQLIGLTGNDAYAPAFFDLSGDTILSGEITTDQIYGFSTVGINGVSIEGSEPSLDAFIGGTGPGVFFGAVDAITGETFFYETDTDSIIANTSVNTFETVVTDTELAALSGDDIISGLAASDGVLFFGNASGSSPLVEGIYAFDTNTGTGEVLVTADQADAILGGTNGINPTNTGFFAAPNGDIFFFDSGFDAILSFDPDDPLGTLGFVLTQAEILAGPANSGLGTSSSPVIGITDLGWVDGELAFLIGSDSSVTGAIAGIYAIPEPASAALLGLGGLAMLRRRSA
ncbi:MAG: PEP-CTERM sorting domain-containing protein [Planctomycetota bacterium]